MYFIGVKVNRDQVREYSRALVFGMAFWSARAYETDLSGDAGHPSQLTRRKRRVIST